MPDIKLTRTHVLLIAAVALVLLWQGGGTIYENSIGLIQSKRRELEELTNKVDRKELQAKEVDFARQRLLDWKSRSLPPDDAAALTAKKPDALKAHLKYQETITDLVHLSGFDGPSIRPAPSRIFVKEKDGSNNIYISMTVTVEADVTYGQLCTFLDHFYRMNLLHRISRLHVDSRESAGDPLIRITLDCEALALAEVPPRRTLFAETTLTAKLAAADTQCQVASSEGFPKKPPFRVRIGTEYLTVTAVDGPRWTIQRAAERTHAADHNAGNGVQFIPLNPAFPSKDADDFRELLAANPFIKPPPPRKYEPKYGPTGEQVFVRGKTFELTITASNYDPTLGKPEYSIASGAPPGLQFDRGTGKITWKPADDQLAGKYPMMIEARHPSSPGGKQELPLTIVFREPNTTPQLKPGSPPVAYIGREWKFPLDVTDAETSREKLSIKLGDGAPQGLTVANGELHWTPPESLLPGNFNVQVTVTDDGTPPQSATATVPLKLEDDAAQFTKLTGVVGINDEQMALLFNQLRDQSTRVRIGDTVHVADVTGIVTDIKPKYLLLKQGEQVLRWNLGATLRELEKTSTPEPRPESEALTTPEAEQ